MRRPDTAIRLTAILVSLAYAAILYWAGVRVDADVKKLLAYLPTLAVVALVAWDLQLWRWPLVHLLVTRPRLDGLWKATIRPTSESHIPAGGNRGPISAYLAINQTFWKFQATLITRESHSLTQSHYWFNTDAYPVEWISFIYENAPQQRYRHRSTRHLGACTLRPGDKAPTSMSATYFTDRYTQGDMELELVGRDGRVVEFSEAEKKEEVLRRKAKKSADRKSVILGWLKRSQTRS